MLKIKNNCLKILTKQSSTSRGFESQGQKVIEMTYFYEEIIQSEKDTKRKLRNMPRLTAFGCFFHWCPARDFSFHFIWGIQHFDHDLWNPAKGTQMIHSQMISHNFNQWIYRILTAIYHKYIYFFYI